MVDLLRIYAEKYNFNFTYIFESKESLISYNGTDLVINPYSYNLNRFQQFDFGFPFLTSPEHIYTLKPEIKVSLHCIIVNVHLTLLNSQILKLLRTATEEFPYNIVC